MPVMILANISFFHMMINMPTIFFENYNGTFYLNVWDDSDIQDMGSTQDIWDISYAPNGWMGSVKTR